MEQDDLFPVVKRLPYPLFQLWRKDPVHIFFTSQFSSIHYLDCGQFHVAVSLADGDQSVFTVQGVGITLQ